MGLKTLEEILALLEEKEPWIARHWKKATDISVSKALTHPQRIKAIGLSYNRENQDSRRFMISRRAQAEKVIREATNNRLFVLVIIKEKEK